jgi:hypothetical protein
MSYLADPMRRSKDALARADASFEPHPTNTGMLARIVSSALIATTVNRYLYQWEEAWIGGAAPYTTVAKTNALSGAALSVSELGNGTYVAYGVTFGGIPAGFAPVAIPNGTPVWIVPSRKNNGELVWLILNTQAIDGTCDV